MRAAIFNPYLDTLGGGERYTVSFARVLIENNWKVDLEWQDAGIKELLEKRFGINISQAQVVPDIKRGDGYDLCFWVSDGSIPALKSRKNILHFQVPFKNVGGISLLNKMKLYRVNNIVCNSEFTKKVIDVEYGVKSTVLYPPVSVSDFKPGRKENIILYVGRFSPLLQNKNQDVLIKAFMKFYDSGHREWKMVIAGGVETGAEKYLSGLVELKTGYPIELIKSPNYEVLKNLYKKSRFFWSAAGYGEDENKHPEKVEHFGMTVVEAMAAGCIPVVFNAGGHKEIIENGVNGFMWSDTSELISKTAEIISSKQSAGFLKNIRKTSEKFSYEVFREEVSKFL